MLPIASDDFMSTDDSLNFDDFFNKFDKVEDSPTVSGVTWRLASKNGQTKFFKLINITSQEKNEFQLTNTYLREAFTLSSIDHPNIIKVYKAFILPNNKLEKILCVETELKGSNWVSLSVGQSAFTEEHAFRLIYQMGLALSTIHSRHLLHRKVTPANIISNSNLDQFVLINFDSTNNIDTHSSIGNSSVGVGSANEDFLAPEILRAKVCEDKYSYLSDVFALGVTVAKLLTGNIHLPINMDIFINRKESVSVLLRKYLYGKEISDHLFNLLCSMLERVGNRISVQQMITSVSALNSQPSLIPHTDIILLNQEFLKVHNNTTLCIENLQKRFLENPAYACIGCAKGYILLKNYDKALECLKKGYEVAKDCENLCLLNLTYVQMIIAKKDTVNYGQALKMLGEVENSPSFLQFKPILVEALSLKCFLVQDVDVLNTIQECIRITGPNSLNMFVYGIITRNSDLVSKIAPDIHIWHFNWNLFTTIALERGVLQ